MWYTVRMLAAAWRIGKRCDYVSQSKLQPKEKLQPRKYEMYERTRIRSHIFLDQTTRKLSQQAQRFFKEKIQLDSVILNLYVGCSLSFLV